jgi:hypothetical protein
MNPIYKCKARERQEGQAFTFVKFWDSKVNTAPLKQVFDQFVENSDSY